MDDHTIPCQDCANAMSVDDSLPSVTCSNCQATYQVTTTQKYSTGGTGTYQALMWSKSKIEIVYTENPPIDQLDLAYQAHRKISPSETNPMRLQPIFKNYYDALFKRLQDTLSSARSNLDSEERDNIFHNPPRVGHNITTLLPIVARAFPVIGTEFNNLLKTYARILPFLPWLRNKVEHVGIRSWTNPSFCHTDSKKNPSSKSPVIFDAQFLRQLNHLVIGAFALLLQGDSRPPDSWEIEKIRSYEIQ